LLLLRNTQLLAASMDWAGQAIPSSPCLFSPLRTERTLEKERKLQARVWIMAVAYEHHRFAKRLL
jgi:hypothetical protein